MHGERVSPDSDAHADSDVQCKYRDRTGDDDGRGRLHFLDGVGGSQFGVGKQCDFFDWKFYDCDCYQSGNICESELPVDGVSASGRFNGIDNPDCIVPDIECIQRYRDDYSDGGGCANLDADEDPDAGATDGDTGRADLDADPDPDAYRHKDADA